MKFALVFLLAVSSVLAFEQAEYKEWIKFKKIHNKEYETVEHEFKRFNIWKSNTDIVKKHNEEANDGKHSYWLKINKYADLTAEEFGKIYNGFRQSKSSSRKPTSIFTADPDTDLPESVDWRSKGYVTPIKDQGQCGSCWSFSATGSLEGQHFKKTGDLVSLSEQNLVDCSRSFGNMGCNGGLMDQAFQYIKSNDGIDTEESYPYKARDGRCKFNPANVGATDTGFVDVKSMDEDALKQAVATVGPISVAIDASHYSFQLYSHGVYHEDECSSTELDHGVLAVGYGTDSDSGKDYWLVKNSWGTVWGDNGYIRMSRNQDNNCGIATQASYPLV